VLSLGASRATWYPGPTGPGISHMAAGVESPWRGIGAGSCEMAGESAAHRRAGSVPRLPGHSAPFARTVIPWGACAPSPVYWGLCATTPNGGGPPRGAGTGELGRSSLPETP